jgi:hypothetical protein
LALVVTPRPLLASLVGFVRRPLPLAFPVAFIASSGEPKVGYIDPFVDVHQDVVGLEVAMDDARVVGGLESTTRRAKGSQNGVSTGASALDEGHRQEHPAFVQANVVYGDQVGVGQLGHRLRLTQEATGSRTPLG